MPDGLLQVVLEIEPGSEPVRGWLRPEYGQARRFDSWLELISALDRVLETGERRRGGDTNEED